MTTKELKELLQNLPDEWKVIVQQPEEDRYHVEGAFVDTRKCELVIQV